MSSLNCHKRFKYNYRRRKISRCIKKIRIKKGNQVTQKNLEIKKVQINLKRAMLLMKLKEMSTSIL